MLENDRNEGPIQPAINLSLDECTVLFPRLKGNESSLTKDERIILLKMEKLLYENLSIQEIDELLGQTEGKSGMRGGNSGGRPNA